MQVVPERCCGLDIHKKTVVAGLLMLEATGQRHKEIRTFQTVLAELVTLKAWLQEAGCTYVAMESTGVYWKPIWNVLEGHFELVLANAPHLKAVPGHKTDVRAAEWMADLLQHGLLRASFVPTAPQRALRDLTRSRTRLLQDRSRAINRVHQVLEETNSKLASVATDIMGLSAPAIRKRPPGWTNRSWSPGRPSSGTVAGQTRPVGTSAAGDSAGPPALSAPRTAPANCLAR